MILIQAAKLTTAQRRVVRKVAQFKKGDTFKIDDKIKSLNLKITEVGKEKDTFKSIPKRIAEYASKIAKTTGEFSKNPIKKVVSWVKGYVKNFKELLNEYKLSKKATPEIKPETPEVQTPKPETIKFSKEDL